MIKEDRKEVVELVGLVVKPIVETINQRFSKLDLINESIIKRLEKQDEAIKLISDELIEQRKDFQKAMQSQTNRFLSVLEKYEKRTDRHEINFKNMKESIGIEEEEEE